MDGKSRRESGRPTKLWPDDRRVLLREVHKEDESAKQLCCELEQPTGKNRVLKILRDTPTLRYKKYKPAPPLTAQNKIFFCSLSHILCCPS